jgi:nitrogen regulatory protein PII
MIAVSDHHVVPAVTIIRNAARTGKEDGPGAIGDGKIFVTYIEDVFTIRTAEDVESGPEVPARAMGPG